ncbi:MAG: CCA tRNA nucleotidyltransferase, partial [Acidimicrobiia bacterium]|nr:CCA tRNA nucleotidyltransferase [Acidimicrobiia bacterium]
MIPARLDPLLRPDGAPVALARRFEAAGHELFLVGGSVRDALLGRSRSDEEHDFATAARPAEVRRLVAGWADEVYTVGEAFGTVGILKDGARLEITTFRAEVYRDDSRKPVVQYSDDLETDLSRRDFTVNATALRLVPAPEIIDPYGGLVDLGAGVLRTPLDPGIAFEDDPLRMLRLFRFVSVLGFRAADDAVGAVRAMRERLAIVSAERVRDELNKLLVGEHVEAGLWGLVDSGLAGEFLPELTAL